MVNIPVHMVNIIIHMWICVYNSARWRYITICKTDDNL